MSFVLSITIKSTMLGAIMLSVVMMYVIMLNVVMMNVVAPLSGVAKVIRYLVTKRFFQNL